MGKEYRPSDSLNHHEPIGGTGAKRYEFEKVPAATALKGIILSESVHGILAHYFRRSTRPHEDQNCQGCIENAPFKWVGYFFALNPATKAIYVVQVPPGPYPTFLQFQETYNTLRGSKFVLWRSSKTLTGQVSACLTMPDNAEFCLPPCPDIRKPLDRLFYGGYKNVKFLNPTADQTPVQTIFIPDMPRGITPIQSSVENAPMGSGAKQYDGELGCAQNSIGDDVDRILKNKRNGRA